MRLARYWKTRNSVSTLLWPLSLVFIVLSAIRRFFYRAGVFPISRLSVPVIVIGNIIVGGSGKTPLTIALVRELRNHGFRPGVVSRGYGGNSQVWPQRVVRDSDPFAVGDEPVEIAREAGCPVAVAPKRAAAAQLLLEQTDCDVLICDDGLQHYALDRDLEIAIVDPSVGVGNGLRLPAGPLRESRRRLESVDWVVHRGEALQRGVEFAVVAGPVRSLHKPDLSRSLASFSGQPVHAVAGIAFPERFFAQLESAGLTLRRHAFSDHHRFSAADLAFGDQSPVLMTQKDAVKCASFADDRIWAVTVRSELDPRIVREVVDRLHSLRVERQHGQEVT